MAPYVAQLLVDPYESVRIIGQRALRTLPGFAAFEHDLTASAEVRAAAKREALSICSEQQAGQKLAGSARARVLLADDGNVIAEAFARLLKRRDNKLIRLFE